MAALPFVGEVSIFWIGAFGSIAVEICAAAKACADLDGACPQRYKKPFYIFTRFALAATSGAVPTVLEAANGLTAFYMGVSAPLIIDRLQRGLEPGENGQMALPQDLGATATTPSAVAPAVTASGE
ncbi:hypothetical protein [Sinorhizobium fredii]|uniref:hypothetical protein n=1 Tax=Rhizobium fredii TaxID=380 RepID=UPI00055CB68F|nr:hypothetical protein [Sinorhizobium fredii]